MTSYDNKETFTISGVVCRRGSTLPFGASVTEDGGINFSVSSFSAAGCCLQLYHREEYTPFADIRFPECCRTGSNYAITVLQQNPEELEYTFRFFGVPECPPETDCADIVSSQGHTPEFHSPNPGPPLLDPYTRLLSGREVWGEICDRQPPLRSRILTGSYSWEDDQPLGTPIEDLVIYELHVRGFTNAPSCPATHRGTFNGIVEMIPWLNKLGINCVELMPVFEFDETDIYPLESKDEQLCNFWGYQPICFFAPKSAYASSSSPANEMKDMIKALHRNGIEVILDAVFNHTGEEDGSHAILNYRGIDASTYYLLDENGNHRNLTGCPNTVNCNNPVVRQHIIDCLRYWVSEYHVDGFRLDEAPILTRDEHGEPMQRPPLLEAIACDPILSGTKLIAEPFDAAGLCMVGTFPGPDLQPIQRQAHHTDMTSGRWAEWNPVFQTCLRRFVKSDASAGPELLQRIRGSQDLSKNQLNRNYINYVTCHDGFTLNDLVSYNEKHNLSNSEDNLDGIDDNNSWNCGVEGPTDDPEIEALRNRQVKNAYALLMLSRGTPMVLAGDEFRNSQQGNNNPYCHDTPLSWVNWENRDRYPDVIDFCRHMIRLRREHPVLRRPGDHTAENSSGYPELSFHGEHAWQLNMWEPFLTFGFMYAEPAADFGTEEDCFVYCGVNAHWEAHRMELPRLPEGMYWHLYADSSGVQDRAREIEEGSIQLGPRSLTVLLGK